MMVAMSSRLTYRSREKLSFTSGTPQEHTSGQRQRQRQHSISITFLYYILIFIILFAYFVKMVSFDNILFYLVGSKDKYKPGTEESAKRAIRKAAKAYCVQGDALYHQGDESCLRRVVMTEEEKTPILEEAHAGHFGRARMEAKIRQRFYWQNIREDVDNWVTCTVPPGTLSPQEESSVYM